MAGDVCRTRHQHHILFLGPLVDGRIQKKARSFSGIRWYPPIYSGSWLPNWGRHHPPPLRGPLGAGWPLPLGLARRDPPPWWPAWRGGRTRRPDPRGKKKHTLFLGNTVVPAQIFRFMAAELRVLQPLSATLCWTDPLSKMNLGSYQVKTLLVFEMLEVSSFLFGCLLSRDPVSLTASIPSTTSCVLLRHGSGTG